MQEYYIGIAINKSWIFSAEFGNSIGLYEAEPELIINKSRQLTNILLSGFNSLNLKNVPNIHGLVQFGEESTIFFEDFNLVESIANLSNDFSDELKPVMPIIHMTNSAWPERPVFIDTLKKTLKLARKFKDESIIIHLNAADIDNNNKILQKTLDALTTHEILNLVSEFKIKLCFENNHHMSYFGYPENIINFYSLLDSVLNSTGNGNLIPYYSFCFDLGHMMTQLHKAGRDVESDIINFLDKFSHRIGTFHIHSNSGKWDDHLLPIDYDQLLALDKEKKYNRNITEKHTKIVWNALSHWRNLEQHRIGKTWFIFELDVLYKPQQLFDLGKKLASCFKLNS